MFRLKREIGNKEAGMSIKEEKNASGKKAHSTMKSRCALHRRKFIKSQMSRYELFKKLHSFSYPNNWSSLLTKLI